ncbi:MAG: isoleucine--tRNA ligase [Candidatus Diapherotrites archaeon]|nr:isoleucine--tRNA ligase [Candidatus Diapherotrites archaeon]
MKILQPYSRAQEEEIRAGWKKNDTARNARARNKGKEAFFMLDGPPYASGSIHMGTAFNKILKDTAIRMKRMQGLDSSDQPGYDTHGLPIEHKVEENKGIRFKSEIEAMGVVRFVNSCREFATHFIDVMTQEFDNLGVWMDWENPYVSCSNEYIEAIWWTFKKADERGLLYLGKYPVHACPHCETAVAYNEIEYEKKTDNSVYVKLPLQEEKGIFLLVWTTTPWTLPANSGVMVNPKADYVQVKAGEEEHWIVARELLPKLETLFKRNDFLVEKEFKGQSLEGKKYSNPLSPHLNLGTLPAGIYRVILSERYVTLDEGTGLVHSSPGHGKEDFDAGTRAGLPVLCPVGLNGVFDTSAGKYEGKKAREVDPEIIEDLKKANALVLMQHYTHDYPVCWRCKSPLLMISSAQWFFKISQIRQRLIDLNQEVTWVPSWGKDRFNNWLEQLGDWPVSRARYWGTPLPIWLCECGKKKIVESRKELASLTSIPADLDLHKPWIDAITIPCPCGKQMKRVPEVLDVWFDSGVASWGSLGYPQKKEEFERLWPADFNLEGKDQIRGWWNSQLITSVICFDQKPFETIFLHGMVLDVSKKKMSKSLGNTIKPSEVIEKFNRDYLRYYGAARVRGEDMSFAWADFEAIHRFFGILWNVYNYAALYLELEFSGKEPALNGLASEDRWLLGRFNQLTDEAVAEYNVFHFSKVVELMESFVVEELSRTYIKLIRSEKESRQPAISATLNYVLFGLIRLMAPIIPHFSEFIYQQARSPSLPESVHLTEFPKPVSAYNDQELLAQFELAKQISQTVLALREEHKLRRRWPLPELVIMSPAARVVSRVSAALALFCNVKSVRESTQPPSGTYVSKEFSSEIKLFLSSDVTPELLDEWELMELRRRIQEKRKEARLLPTQTVSLAIECSDPAFLQRFKKEIEESTSTRLVPGKGTMEKLLEREFFFELKTD